MTTTRVPASLWCRDLHSPQLLGHMPKDVQVLPPSGRWLPDGGLITLFPAENSERLLEFESIA